MSAVWAIIKLTFKEIARKKDFYVAIMLMGVILFFASRMNFYNVENISRYLRELGLSLIFIFSAAITVPLAARQFPSETRDRTLPVLLAKPVPRAAFIIGKFLGAALAGICAFLVFYLIFLAFTLKVPPQAMVTVQTAVLFSLGLMLLAAMATGLSFYMTFSANVSVSLVIYVLMIAYGEELRGFFKDWPAGLQWIGEAVYRFLPHFEFFDIRQRFIHDWGAVQAGAVVVVAAYALVYSGFFLLLGWVRFRRSFV